ncbi:DNA polymerase I [Candidatus Hepatincolaceae symbiont of Richtersius coronifer]
MAKLCLIDGSGFIFRAFHALPPLVSKSGIPVNAVYGFTKSMMALQQNHVDFIAIIFDSSRITFRQSLYPSYKAHRPEAPAELIPQFSLIRRAAKALNIMGIEKEGFEADDLIATYAKLAVEKGLEVEIISSDKDLMQLLSDEKKVYMFDAFKKRKITEKDVLEKFGVLPKHVIAVQALMGDNSDNVPGVKGIGPKTASALINQFHTLENLYANLEDIPKQTLKDKLQDNKDLAFLSEKLVTLKNNVPINMSIEELKWTTPKPLDLYSFLNELSFTSLAIKIAKDYGLTHTENLEKANKANEKVETNLSNPPLIQNNPNLPLNPLGSKQEKKQAKSQIVTLLKDLKSLLVLFAEVREVGILPHLTILKSKQIILDKIIIFHPQLNINYHILIKSKPTPDASPSPQTTLFNEVKEHRAKLDDEREIDLTTFISLFQQLLENPAQAKIFYNAKDFFHLIYSYGVKLKSFEDIMLMAYLLKGEIYANDESFLQLSQKEFFSDSSYLNLSQVSSIAEENSSSQVSDALLAEDTLTSSVFNHSPIKMLDQPQADWLFSLYHNYMPQLIKEKCKYLYENFDKPLILILLEMEQNGILIDKKVLKDLSKEFFLSLADLEDKIFQISGEKFNLGSPKQIGEVLFNKIGIKGKKNKTGSWKTSANFLQELADEGLEVATLILKWRQISKLKNTYSDKLVLEADSLTNRIHTRFLQSSTATGRLSSIAPNLQNIPIKSSEGKKIRQAFIAPQGYKILSLDYSQIELRILATIANVVSLKQSFINNEDIHSKTASEIFNVPLKDINKDLRRKAKTINFGIIYGQSPFGLANQLGVSHEVAAKYIEAYFYKYPEIKTYMNQTITQAQQYGYVTTLFNRKCFIRDIHNSSFTIKSFSQRAAINAPIQGTAADIMRKAMHKVHQQIKSKNLNAKLLLQIHDEIVIEVKEEEALKIAQELKYIMEHLFQEITHPDGCSQENNIYPIGAPTQEDFLTNEILQAAKLHTNLDNSFKEIKIRNVTEENNSRVNEQAQKVKTLKLEANYQIFNNWLGDIS